MSTTSTIPTQAGPVSQTEDVPVTLARIDGKLDLIAAGVKAVSTRADVHDEALREHGGRLQILELTTQRLDLQAESREATVVVTAAAVKAADEARRDKSDGAWATPSRVVAMLAGLAVVLGLYLNTTGVI